MEMGGIEPPSTAVSLRLLRVQSAEAFSSAPTIRADTLVEAQPQKKSPVTLRLSDGASSLDDARVRVGSTPGLTDYRARLSSEGEVGALSIGTYSLRGAFTR